MYQPGLNAGQPSPWQAAMSAAQQQAPQAQQQNPSIQPPLQINTQQPGNAQRAQADHSHQQQVRSSY